MQTPVVAELPSKRIQAQRRVAKTTRALQPAMYVAYRRRSATGTTRVATALTRWVGR
jgi:hypothetical protein